MQMSTEPSAPTAVVVARSNSPATGTPTITGTVQVGETLTADTSSIADDDGLDNATFSYQWITDDGTSEADIQDATDSTYTLAAEDEGKAISVRASFTDDAGNAESLTSAATAAVEDGSNSHDRPHGLQSSARAGAITLTWQDSRYPRHLRLVPDSAPQARTGRSGAADLRGLRVY